MAAVTENKVDDDSCSVDSFEDIGNKPSAAVTLNSGQKEEPPVPDLLYVVQYRNLGGRVVETRKSEKPLDIAHDHDNHASSDDKPVIEILTSVSATLKAKPRPLHPYPPGHPGGPRPGGFGRHPMHPHMNPPELDPDSKDLNLGKVETTQMIIHSKHLQAALNAVIGYYPGTDFIGERVSIDAPYRVLIHYRKELELYKVNQPIFHDEEYATTTAKHIDVLLAFLKATFGPLIEAEESRWNAIVPMATFDLFWLLLKPGEILYVKEDNHWNPCVISSLGPTHRDSDGRRAAIIVAYWTIEYCNNRLQRCMGSVTVHPFSGEQAIQGLSVIPGQFFPGGAKGAAEKQIRLGREYWELSKAPAHKEYEGEAIDKDGNQGGKVQGRVIVDCDGYHRLRDSTPGARQPRPPPVMMNRRPMPPPNAIPPLDHLPQLASRCPCQPCRKSGQLTELGPFSGFDNLDPNKDTPPDNDLYFYALSDLIPAFVLGERRWAMLKIEDLRDVKHDREAFKYLVLDDEIKLAVKALIGKFANAEGKVSPWPSDFVKNKGEGRIFLLHGSPGVGKTCTAECVAELTHRPLLALTSGDISTSGSTSSVERNLAFFLRLGERYGALVLLDEADVYLEERRTRDLYRNGLVSIFLRALEYYRGVLFLTTNRVEAFDAAFTSRIHVALHYKRLTNEDRLRIWTHNFERLERDSGGKVYVPHSARSFCHEADEVRSLQWNGREIRNALQTAVALAETEALEDGVDSVTVTDKHLRAVVKMSRGFKDYLRKRRGWNRDDDHDDDEEEEEEEEGGSGSESGNSVYIHD